MMLSGLICTMPCTDKAVRLLLFSSFLKPQPSYNSLDLSKNEAGRTAMLPAILELGLELTVPCWPDFEEACTRLSLLFK